MRLDDKARLEAIERSGLLRHPQQDRLDHLCYSAAELIGCELVQLNVVTADFQHCVAEWPSTSYEDHPISDSGCREVVMAQEPVVVENTRTHPVMCDMPWAAQWGAYLGVPLWHEDQVIGTFCARNRGPTKWRSTDVLALTSLAGLAISSID